MIYILEVSNELREFLDNKLEYKKVIQKFFKTKDFVVTEEELIEDNRLSSIVKVYKYGKLSHVIKNSIEVEETDKGYKIGGKYLEELSSYMLRMLHPRYKSYKQLLEYAKGGGKN